MLAGHYIIWHYVGWTLHHLAPCWLDITSFGTLLAGYYIIWHPVGWMAGHYII